MLPTVGCLLLAVAVWELFTSQRVFEEGLSIGQIFYMSEWLAMRLGAASSCQLMLTSQKDGRPHRMRSHYACKRNSGHLKHALDAATISMCRCRAAAPYVCAK
jgi:hypothetical protein